MGLFRLVTAVVALAALLTPGQSLAAPGDTGPRPDHQTGPVVPNKEGVWGLAVDSAPGVCVAEARPDDRLRIQLLAAGGRIGLALASDSDMPRGRAGRVQTDAYGFDFTPSYGGARYLTSQAPFDRAAVEALRRAKWLRVSVDSRQLLDIDVTGTGFAEVLDSVAACSRGEKGWWGKGARE